MLVKFTILHFAVFSLHFWRFGIDEKTIKVYNISRKPDEVIFRGWKNGDYMEILKYTVNTSEDGTEAKEFLRKKGLSATIIKRAKLGGITVNGREVTVRYKLEAGEVVEVALKDVGNEAIIPVEMPLKIVYEDDFILVVDKPTNMPTHPAKGVRQVTLANAVVAYLGKDFVFRAITRLDRDTSGLVLIAKNQFAASRLSGEMKEGKFVKKYRCTVCGIPKEAHGIIDAPIRRMEDGSIKRIVAEDGKRAITEYRILSTEGENAILEIILHTGRTHQIRVHMAHIGHPLVNDFLYGNRTDGTYSLRCFYLKFSHPQTNKTIELSI